MGVYVCAEMNGRGRTAAVSTIASYADIGTDSPDEKPLLPMEAVFLAILLIIFYYKLFIAIGCSIFDWIYSSELQNQFSKTLGPDDDEYQQEFVRHVKKSNCFRKYT
ncbi:Protein CBG08557 [Caenorhabditis briggsae]|uniref:Protein CBG08557 n=2 Tax=Caenorhabditis TaxID=6237 RepID=A8X748_CAEBR|nr:Protein CBG08557 [Caenorhabditis briggsae]CAP28459.2 Protein CBG08557 [Caenorhabditis briggsae]